MAKAKVHQLLREAIATPAGAALVVGYVVDIAANGRATVDYPGNPAGPVAARSLIQRSAEEWARAGARPGVVLMLENGDPRRPIIMGLADDSCLAPAVPDGEKAREPEMVLDAKRLVFAGQEEVVIRCGEGSITLTKDGRLVLKGRELVSRATEANKIRGALVSIN